MFDTRRTLLGSIAIGLVGTAGCTGTPDGGEEFTITTTAFDEGDPIPPRHTCSGADDSPPLFFDGVPDATGAFAIVVDDPDAPGGTFTHWLIWNVPAERTTVPAGVAARETVSSLGDARQGENDFGTVGYRGPCPPVGDGPHTYRFRGYALERSLDVPAGSDRETLSAAIEDAALASDILTGTFERQ